MSRVTVCVPVFEGEAFLEKTMAKIQSQTHGDLRIFASVDRSEDRSLALCRDLAASDPRIAVFAQDRRLGFVGNVNFLLRQVDSEFFCVTPQDDWLTADYVASLLEPLREDPGVALAYADVERSDGKQVQFQASLSGPRDERLLRFVTRQINWVEWHGLVRSACTAEDFPFRPGENVDQAFPLKLARRGHLVRVPRPLYWKNFHPRSATAHQREPGAGRLERLADSLTDGFNSYELAHAALAGSPGQPLLRVALLLRCLCHEARQWPPDRTAPDSEIVQACFGAIRRNELRDVLTAWRAVEALNESGAHPAALLAILRAAACFHLARMAERHLDREDAARFLSRALDFDPTLAEADAFHRWTRNRILGG